jgi:hypothetical protein
MIKTLLFIYLLWKFGNNVIFQMNKVWKEDKPAKGEVKQNKKNSPNKAP